MPKPWTRKEQQRVIAMSQIMTAREIAEITGRTIAAIYAVIHERKSLHKKRFKRKPYTLDNDVRIMHKEGKSDIKIATVLKSVSSVIYRIRKRLGLPANFNSGRPKGSRNKQEELSNVSERQA
jgi:transposase